MDNEFKEICMSKRVKEIEPSTVEILNPVEMSNLAKSHKTLSNYFFTQAMYVLSKA